MVLTNTTDHPIDLGTYSVGGRIFRLRFGPKYNDAILDASRNKATIEVPADVVKLANGSAIGPALRYYKERQQIMAVSKEVPVPQKGPTQGFVDGDDGCGKVITAADKAS